ncbi:hypothetical protein PUN28_016250 [Cardiocondyla obscurior]|uniref:Uncharacterized protein n=1 Tax=Cardiocondyla obscurior TaxID=286306 RepID=A0AAW2EUA4_9HYME
MCIIALFRFFIYTRSFIRATERESASVTKRRDGEKKKKRERERERDREKPREKRRKKGWKREEINKLTERLYVYTSIPGNATQKLQRPTLNIEDSKVFKEQIFTKKKNIYVHIIFDFLQSTRLATARPIFRFAEDERQTMDGNEGFSRQTPDISLLEKFTFRKKKLINQKKIKIKKDNEEKTRKESTEETGEKNERRTQDNGRDGRDENRFLQYRTCDWQSREFAYRHDFTAIRIRSSQDTCSPRRNSQKPIVPSHCVNSIESIVAGGSDGANFRLFLREILKIRVWPPARAFNDDERGGYS